MNEKQHLSFKMNFCGGFVSLLLILFFGCSGKRKAEPANNENLLPYTVVRVFPHDVTAFTQGFAIDHGRLFESTGQENSWIAEVDIASGAQTKKVVLDKSYFGEGITILNNRVYQLTWKNHTGFVYDLGTFRKIREFKYSNEGWGLTHNGTDLIMSDGTANLYFLDTLSLKVKSTVTVKEAGGEVRYLNELEFIEGYIYANQWQTNYIFKIDPVTGNVAGKLDLSTLMHKIQAMNPEADVLNGIAYEKKSKTLLVTGKRWPAVFALRLSP
jgi:glutaminyl-peptide cyclotransferase